MTSAKELKLLQLMEMKILISRIWLFTTKIEKKMPDLSQSQEKDANVTENNSPDDNYAQSPSKLQTIFLCPKYMKVF